MTVTNAATLRDAVCVAEATIRQANKTFLAAQRAAEQARYTAQAPAHAALKDLQRTYQDRALELAVEAGQCPFERWGSHMAPHEVSVREDGIWLFWDINGDYAPANFLASWDALVAPVEVEGAVA